MTVKPTSFISAALIVAVSFAGTFAQVAAMRLAIGAWPPLWAMLAAAGFTVAAAAGGAAVAQRRARR